VRAARWCRSGSATATCALFGVLAVESARGAEPCAGLPADDGLRRLVETTTGPAAADARALALAALTERTDAAGRACAHYALGSLAFVESLARGPEGAREAVVHLLAAQALDPVGLAERRPRKRLENAWRRVGDVGTWRSDRAPVAVRLALPSETSSWGLAPDCAQGRCGDDDAPDAAQAPWLDIPHAGAAGTAAGVLATLPAGISRLRVRTPCGESSLTIDVRDAGARFEVPPPACSVSLHVTLASATGHVRAYDRGGRALPADTPLEAALGEVWVAAPHHRPQRVPLPTKGGQVEVALRPCRARLIGAGEAEGATLTPSAVLFETPTDVHVERPGDVGLVAQVAVPASHAAAHCAPTWRPEGEGTVTALPPDDDAAPWPVEAILERPVRVQQTHEALEPLLSLEVGGASLTRAELPLLSVAPGEYPWRAVAESGARAEGTLSVARCAAPPCPPVTLEVSFGTPVAPPTAVRAPVIVGGVGLAVIGGGLVAGWGALETQRRLDGYSDKRSEGVSVTTLERQRGDRATLANTLVGVGGALALSGLVWWWLEGTP